MAVLSAFVESDAPDACLLLVSGYTLALWLVAVAPPQVCNHGLAAAVCPCLLPLCV